MALKRCGARSTEASSKGGRGRGGGSWFNTRPPRTPACTPTSPWLPADQTSPALQPQPGPPAHAHTHTHTQTGFVPHAPLHISSPHLPPLHPPQPGPPGSQGGGVAGRGPGAAAVRQGVCGWTGCVWRWGCKDGTEKQGGTMGEREVGGGRWQGAGGAAASRGRGVQSHPPSTCITSPTTTIPIATPPPPSPTTSPPPPPLGRWPAARRAARAAPAPPPAPPPARRATPSARSPPSASRRC